MAFKTFGRAALPSCCEPSPGPPKAQSPKPMRLGNCPPGGRGDQPRVLAEDARGHPWRYGGERGHARGELLVAQVDTQGPRPDVEADDVSLEQRGDRPAVRRLGGNVAGH